MVLILILFPCNGSKYELISVMRAMRIIEIDSSAQSGWSNEEIVYDFVKLMDKNPIKLGVSQNVILRKKEHASKREQAHLIKS